MQPKVSVIIPVYNVEKYLRQCLDSVINQTLKDIEIICVDDGSTDNSGKILDEYAEKDNRIKVIHKKNEGYGKAMNIGFDNATGEYLGIVEPDDYIKLNMYEVLYKTAVENDVDFVKADFYSFVNKNGKQKLFYNKFDKSKKYYNRIINPQEDITSFKLTTNSSLGTWSAVYKRNFIEKYNIRYNETPGASYQDQGFWFQTFCRATKIYFIEQPCYMYRFDNPNSSIHSKEKVFCIKEEYDFIRKFLDNNVDLKEKFLGIYNYCRFYSYEYNFMRITFCFKKIFLNFYNNDFKQACDNKEIDEKLFSRWGLFKIHILVKYSRVYYCYKIIASLILNIIGIIKR